MRAAYGAMSNAGFEETIGAVRAALSGEGFGVLTEIDLAATLRDRIGAELDSYVILGACNPAFAMEAVRAEPSVGVLLPCNVVVRRDGDHTVVEAMDPGIIAEMGSSARLAELAAEVQVRIRRAVDAAVGG
jgi:uncharacterized protein (DUF302 family)